MLKLIGKGGRFAGNLLKRGLEPSPGGKVGVGTVADRLGMDALFGIMSAAQTPGDMTDKIIAGTLTTAGGGLGGAVLSGALPGNARFGRMRGVTELAGGIIGDQLSYGTTENILRAKSGTGMSPRERQAAEMDQQYRSALEDEFRKKYGIQPGTSPTLLVSHVPGGSLDPMLYSQGLGGG